MSKNRNRIYKIGAVFAALAVWQVVALIVGSDLLLASPVDVIIRLGQLIFEADFLSTVFYSFLRVSAGFVTAFLAGILMAVLAARFKALEYLLWPFVASIKAVPVASFIILFLIWVDFSVLTSIISFLIAFPVIYQNTLSGIRSTDKTLVEMADLYRVSWGRRILMLYVPAVGPFLVSACSISVGMSWKAGVAAEVIGVVGGSIGEKLYDAKIYFENGDLLAWTLVIVVVSVVFERVFVGLVKGGFAALIRSKR